MIKDGKGALQIKEKKCRWYSITIIPVISSRIPHFYNKCLRRIYQPNRLDVGGYTADHRSLALALVGKLECVHPLVLWTWTALFVDVSTISLYFTNMFWAECLQIPAAAVRPLVRESRIWAERGWRALLIVGGISALLSTGHSHNYLAAVTCRRSWKWTFSLHREFQTPTLTRF